MDHFPPALIALIVFAVLAVVLCVFFRSEVTLSIKSIFGSFSAKGKNPPPPSTVASGVRIEGATTKGALHANSTSGGGIDMKDIEAAKDIDATHTPGVPPPKP